MRVFIFFEVFKFCRFRILKCCFRVFEFRVFQFSNLEFQIQSARPVVAAGVVDPAAACPKQASTGRNRFPSLHSLLWDFMSGSSFREEKTAKVPNVCIPQLPVRFLRRNACYSRGRRGGAVIWREAGGRGIGPQKNTLELRFVGN